MNGRVSWHSQAAPFSAPALYNTPLPTEMGVDVNPFDYVIPSDMFPLLSYMAVRFYRPVPSDKSVLSAYTTSPFSDETVLEEAITQFQQSMAVMEVTVDSTEVGETYPDTFVKPSLLPWFSYIQTIRCSTMQRVEALDELAGILLDITTVLLNFF
ncbi:hypothetical protein PI125_g16530 [Phytophthora idaei]|nr:hypothetical protein PI125_g16530 [Phytophthora idaei]KAG3141628.1 hypothetical protein PI126_g15420 [Phytophthora idaei]